MANAKILKEYLVDENNGYLLNDNNNGKVIMLSGKWGSGKTHFWKKIIATDELKKELSIKNSAYSYVSLYGKSSIEEIENDIFAQLYFSAIGGENIVTQKVSTFTKYTKRYGSIFSEKIEKFANGVKEEQKDNQERIALERLKNGAIICFDDFERKSKDIDLNDLFGFITQLTLNFDCKVVIILNDDVFEGEEKKIFSNVKEKSVSKFLKYDPSIKELFETIFSIERYRVLDKYKEIILKTIEETGELNARIYIQVLDNLVELFNNHSFRQEKYIKYLILVNINFILNHFILKVKLYKDIKNEFNNDTGETSQIIGNHFLGIKVKSKIGIPHKLLDYLKEMIAENLNFIIIKNAISLKESKHKNDVKYIDESEILNQFIDEHQNLIKSSIFILKHEDIIKFESNNETEQQLFNEISNFIETGILINE
ncbi:P-loop NTPase fold protein [Arcobacter aquimarinus]|uniref:P-loop NTPase fold protein n=1 Tax=Arcobacter aquimarinus TaxID=1315211 RepID=UPI003BB18C0B